MQANLKLKAKELPDDQVAALLARRLQKESNVASEGRASSLEIRRLYKRRRWWTLRLGRAGATDQCNK